MLASYAVFAMAVAPVAASATAHEPVQASVGTPQAGDAAASDAQRRHRKGSLWGNTNAWLLAALGVAGLTFALTDGHSNSAPQPVSP